MLGKARVRSVAVPWRVRREAVGSDGCELGRPFRAGLVFWVFPGAMPQAITFWPRWGVWESLREL